MSICTMTVNLTNQEMSALEAIAENKGASKTAIIRQALRLYQTIDKKESEGWSLKCEIVDSDGNPATKNLLVIS